MKIEHMTCIGCPVGCMLTVTLNEDTGEMEVTGNLCPIGDRYGKQELLDPKRMVTSTVEVDGGYEVIVSVKTSESIPKGLVKECVRSLSSLKVKAPVNIGDVIVENILDTGVNIIATANVAPR